MLKNHLKQLILKHLLNFKLCRTQQTKNQQYHHRKNVYFLFCYSEEFYEEFFLAAPPPEPPRPSSTTNETMTMVTNAPANAIVHLMSQFRMDKASEPMPISLTTLEKMSITDTQRLLAESGLEK
jgi:hypothetical protein